MIISIEDDVFEVNTSEAYNKDIFVYNKWIIIPYVNLEIFNINFTQSIIKRYDKLDFSYLLFRDVREIFWNYAVNDEVKYGKLMLNNSSFENDYIIDYVSGADIMNGISGCEIKVKFKEQYLFISKDHLQIKSGPLNIWTPVDTPNFSRNIDEKAIDIFYNKRYIPDEILQFTGADSFSEIEILDLFKPLPKDEQIMIAQNW
ncbi:MULTISPECIES: hypothetical protein [Chryseobacterium]|jgi:hypothetical protein|uniref:Uncharacterized protein n=1 Tax=Chryseobacterium lathyri TaxID=395933 RepID=A0A511YAF0_9FLAO|nr:hypothetical protein [Chryseobacterium lathyri]GEN72170.1 hypothetical protein CLA01_22420 [Chryseobacterium lathyri]